MFVQKLYIHDCLRLRAVLNHMCLCHFTDKEIKKGNLSKDFTALTMFYWSCPPQAIVSLPEILISK